MNAPPSGEKAARAIPPAAFAPTRVAMVGNPNVGKTSLFNRLCGVRAKTANFPGSTVEARVGSCVGNGTELELVDLPGVYAIDLELPESKLCRDCLAGRLEGCMPDALLVVIDATNLARGLRLFRSVANAARPVAVALTMTDLARARGLSIDPARLSVALGVPCVAANGREGTGIEPLVAAILAAREVPPQVVAASLASNWIDDTVTSIVGGPNSLGAENDRLTDRLDAAFTHPVLGGIVFLAAMATIFFAIFRLAELPMELIESGCAWLQSTLAASLPAGAISSLITDGVIGGVSGTIVFLPQICLLFFLLALLEDTGYLARAAFVMDRIMCRFGLPGQAFVPLLSSHACALPGIMSTRLIPDPKDRLATILVAPFVSCSARVGVYVLLVSILFPESGFLAGLAFAGCYALGAIAALATAAIFRRTILKGKSRPMVLELPPYRLPDLRGALLSTYDRAVVFLKNAGSVILAICVVMWWISAYPKAETPRGSGRDRGARRGARRERRCRRRRSAARGGRDHRESRAAAAVDRRQGRRRRAARVRAARARRSPDRRRPHQLPRPRGLPKHDHGARRARRLGGRRARRERTRAGDPRRRHPALRSRDDGVAPRLLRARHAMPAHARGHRARDRLVEMGCAPVRLDERGRVSSRLARLRPRACPRDGARRWRMIAGIPLDDWQFWVVTALAASAVWLVVSPLLPRKRKAKGAACPGCPSGESESAKPRTKHVDLTIGGKRVRN